MIHIRYVKLYEIPGFRILKRLYSVRFFVEEINCNSVEFRHHEANMVDALASIVSWQ